MKIFLPLAGHGTRLRPYTNSIPKCMVKIGKRRMLWYVLKQFSPVKDEIIFIVPEGPRGWMISNYVEDNFPALKYHFVVQPEPLRGQAHALHCASGYLYDDCLILFPDTLTNARLEYNDCPTYRNPVARVFVRRVKNPRGLGLVYTDKNDYVTHIYEKPRKALTRHSLVVTGGFYFPDGEKLARGISKGLETYRTKYPNQELYISTAVNYLIRNGMTMLASEVSDWLTVDTPLNLWQARWRLLTKGYLPA